MLTNAHCVPAAFLCSSDSTYQACVAACEPPESCQDGLLGPLDPEQCQVLGEGCVCSEGTILHRRHSALCIPEEKCGRFLPSRGGTLQAGFALGPPSPSAPMACILPGLLWADCCPREGLTWDSLGLS